MSPGQRIVSWCAVVLVWLGALVCEGVWPCCGVPWLEAVDRVLVVGGFPHPGARVVSAVTVSRRVTVVFLRSFISCLATRFGTLLRYSRSLVLVSFCCRSVVCCLRGSSCVFAPPC